MKINIVIPAHNEQDVISATIKSIEEQLKLDYEIIVVNDHSSDNTVLILNELMGQYPNLRLINNDWDGGFGNALKKGFSVCNAELIIPVMADLCDEPRTINEMHAKALEGFDVVAGSRYMKGGSKSGGPFLQSLFSRFVGSTLRYIIGIPTFDVSNSFKCYRKAVLDSIRPKSEGFEISMEITLKAYFANFSITEVPTSWKGRFIGKSKFYLLKVGPAYVKLYLWAILKNIRKRFS